MSLTLSIIATTLSVLSFCGAAWRIWRDRPRLTFYVRRARIRNQADDVEYKMLQVQACNIGFRPLILTRCLFIGEKSLYSMGIHDNPAAAYGIEDQKFPSIMEPGTTLTFHPIGIDALEENAIDPKDPKVFFDPYKYMVLMDSSGRFHSEKISEIRWHIGLDHEYHPPTAMDKISEHIRKVILFRDVKKRMKRI